MTTMRAKMKISTVKRSEYGEELTMSAVCKAGSYPEDGLDENNTFAKFTPAADLKMQIANPALFGKFNPGECYYLDFIKVEDQAEKAAA